MYVRIVVDGEKITAYALSVQYKAKNKLIKSNKKNHISRNLSTNSLNRTS